MDKLFRVKGKSGIDIKVLAPNSAVARFIVKKFFWTKEKLQVIKARNRKQGEITND